MGRRMPAEHTLRQRDDKDPIEPATSGDWLIHDDQNRASECAVGQGEGGPQSATGSRTNSGIVLFVRRW